MDPLLQQSLTAEAQTVLTNSITEAFRRSHAQTTPLHVAAVLLGGTSGRFLREACTRSNPNAFPGGLDLCFRVALSRMAAAKCSGEPPFSNALNATLKRLRRGLCHEKMSGQKPLPKIQLGHLILSVLDDPSVSRVMREASFCSLAVKAVIEHTLKPQPTSETSTVNSTSLGIGSGVDIERSSYVNPRLGCGESDVKRVLDVLTRVRKRNPVLVGEFQPYKVVKAVLGVIEKDEIHERVLKGVEVISVERKLLLTNFKEFEGLIDRKMELNHCNGGSGVIVDLGDLKWLVDEASDHRVLDMARDVVLEMGRILRRYGERSRIWFIGSATFETYLRCRVCHPTIESEWDLHVVSIVATSSVPRILPRLGSNGGILSSSVECLTRRVSENSDPRRQFSCEILALEAEQVDNSSEVVKSDANRQSLPPWLQNAKMHANDAVKEPTDFAQAKWSAVRTDLALGSMNVCRNNANMNRPKDFPGCEINDIDSFKRLLKGLIEKVGWQTDAAYTIALTVTSCKTGNGKRRGRGLKDDIWLLFLGSDRVGKKNMSIALSELVCGLRPSVIALGSRRDCVNVRGKTVVDRIAEAVRRNPFSVVVLEDVDEADSIVRGSIKRAMERGRIIDSHGREVSLGSVIFVVTSTWTPHQPKDGLALNEEKMSSLASGGWQLRISVGEKNTEKRLPSWLNDEKNMPIKKRKILGQALLFDLNQSAENDDDMPDGSHDSSNLTVEHEDEFTTCSAEPNELLSFVDETVIFKPVDFAPLRRNIGRVISSKISTILGDNLSVEIESEAMEKILSGICLGETTLESWVEKAVVPSIQQLKTILASCIDDHSYDHTRKVRLELDQESASRDFGDWLPSTVSVVTNV